MINQSQYPDAPADLFTSQADFDTLKAYLEHSNARFTLKRQATMRVWRYPTAKVYSQINMCVLKFQYNDLPVHEVVGEGHLKKEARRAAFMALLISLHEKDHLRRLGVTQKLLRAASLSADSNAVVRLDPKEWKETPEEAVNQIYNFAASIGGVPEFSHKAKDSDLDSRLFENGFRMRATACECCVTLPELGLEIAVVGETKKIATQAAASVFKQRVEEMTERVAEIQAQNPNFGILNRDAAGKFIAFLRKRLPGQQIEVDPVTVKSMTTVTAKVDGKDIVEISRPTKKEAVALAEFILAIKLAREHQDVLEDFVKALKEGGGQILDKSSPIRVDISPQTLTLMQQTLRAAEQTGLADFRDHMPAEEIAGPVDQRKWHSGANARSDEELLTKLTHYRESTEFTAMRNARAELPMSQYGEQVLDIISKNKCSIVVGATGSGKTTQVPQLIFEEAIQQKQGSECNILCTQPRRIAAVSVAQRVAEERGESLQERVGYSVRFDRKLASRRGSINYCTTGILLEWIKRDPAQVFDRFSHLVLDEVHERDINVDLLLANLKKFIQVREDEGKPVPKIVLMSATIDTELFANYFASAKDGVLEKCPSVDVPGRLFPVKEKYFAELYAELEKAHGEELSALISAHPDSKTYVEIENEFIGTAQASTDSESASVINWRQPGTTIQDVEGMEGIRVDPTEALVPVALVAATIARVVETSEDGAILVFLPGLDEIKDVQKLLLSHTIFGQDLSDESQFDLHILHSSIPPADQRRVFDASPGRRKIILSTNIAETSVTVPDVKHVIDAGKMRENRYDQLKRMTRLDCVWASKSNVRQRAGRAGRVSDGNYYALFSRERWGSLKVTGLPELLRSDLSEVCLSIKAQGFREKIHSLLAEAIEPPPPTAINAALDTLKSMQALTADEELTVLGRVLSKLPVHPTLGKMILLGIIFKCLDPMLVLGATQLGRSIFTYPLGSDRPTLRRMHRKYGNNCSDHLATYEAIKEVRTIESQYGRFAAFEHARSNFLHFGVYKESRQTAQQIEDLLHSSGLIPDTDRHGMHGGADLNRNSSNLDLVKCVLTAGLQPNFATRKRPGSYPTHRTPTSNNAMMITNSQNGAFDKTFGKGTLFVYSSLSNSSGGMFLRETTLIHPMIAMLFGGRIEAISWATLELDGWQPFHIFTPAKASQSTKLIIRLRHALESLLQASFLSLLGDNFSEPMNESVRNGILELLSSAAADNDPFRDFDDGTKPAESAEPTNNSVSATSENSYLVKPRFEAAS